VTEIAVGVIVVVHRCEQDLCFKNRTVGPSAKVRFLAGLQVDGGDSIVISIASNNLEGICRSFFALSHMDMNSV
jgi:hypothetical protein